MKNVVFGIWGQFYDVAAKLTYDLPFSTVVRRAGILSNDHGQLKAIVIWGFYQKSSKILHPDKLTELERLDTCYATAGEASA